MFQELDKGHGKFNVPEDIDFYLIKIGENVDYCPENGPILSVKVIHQKCGKR
jgi:hypothetical protein